jgi:long-chain acyl-CoA synthetase
MDPRSRDEAESGRLGGHTPRCVRTPCPGAADERPSHVVHPNRNDVDQTFPRTLTEALTVNAERAPDALALASSDGRVSLSWSDYADVARRTAAGLWGLGVRPGDTVALLMGSRPEWQVCDLGSLLAGATPFSMYVTAPPRQTADLLRQASARVLIADPSMLVGLSVPEGVTVVGLDEGPTVDVTLAELQDRTAAASPDLSGSDGVATLIFTSGTTGPPKSVEIRQESIHFMAEAIDRLHPLTGGRHVSYLPHAHIVDRLVGHYWPLLSRSATTTVASPMAVFDDLRAIRPTFFTSVPRIWQRLESRLRASIDGLPTTDRDDVLRDIHSRERGDAGASRPHPWLLDVRGEVGLDSADWLLTGSAPLPADTHRFFAAVGMPLHDCWGLSETTAVATVMPPGDHRFGTVGRPLAGTGVRLADDDEILVKGPHVTRRYRGNSAATADALDGDGWFRSGDLGRWDGEHLVLVGRKKEMMISSGGENMSPSRIESAVVSSSPFIKDAMVVGDGRPFNVALVVPDLDAASGLITADVPPTAPGQRALKEVIAEAIASANQNLSRAESIREVVVLDRDWSAAEGEITPTLKLRRSTIEANFSSQIEELYP